MEPVNDERLIRIVVYTDDPVLGLGASVVLTSSKQFHVTTALPEAYALIPLVEQIRPDMILLELAPEMTLGVIAALRVAVPSSRLVIWGKNFSDEILHQAGELGVAGFLRRGGCTSEGFIANLINIANGSSAPAEEVPEHSRRVALTQRESQLVNLLAQGMKNKEIAACLGITEGTVRIYLSKLFAKIGARDRFEVALFGLKNPYFGQATWDGRDAFVTESDEVRARPVLRSLFLVEPKRRRGYTPAAGE